MHFAQRFCNGSFLNSSQDDDNGVRNIFLPQADLNENPVPLLFKCITLIFCSLLSVFNFDYTSTLRPGVNQVNTNIFIAFDNLIVFNYHCFQ
jgi:hypothetical protein